MSNLSWVVYKAVTDGQSSGPNAVCRQSEWEEMERRCPGRHVLIRGGIRSEGEAERLARGTSGAPSHTAPTRPRPKHVFATR